MVSRVFANEHFPAKGRLMSYSNFVYLARIRRLQSGGPRLSRRVAEIEQKFYRKFIVGIFKADRSLFRFEKGNEPTLPPLLEFNNSEFTLDAAGFFHGVTVISCDSGNEVLTV